VGDLFLFIDDQGGLSVRPPMIEEMGVSIVMGVPQ